MEDLNTICSTCLSSDRTLYPVKLLQNLHNEFNLINLNTSSDSICWECKAIFVKICKFRAQTATAQQLLKKSYQLIQEDIVNMTSNCMSNKLKSLTRLVRESKSYYDVEIQDDSSSGSAVKTEYTLYPHQTPHGVSVTDSAPFKKEKADDSQQYIEEVSENIKQEIFISIENCEDITSDVSDDTEGYHVKRMTEDEVVERRRKAKMAVRYKKKPYKCDMCIVGFTDNSLYKQHICDYHSEDNGYKCGICDSLFPNESKMKKHFEHHFVLYKCEMCNYNNTDLSAIKRHVTERHADTDEFSEQVSWSSEISNDQHKCKVCGKRYKYNFTLTKHMEIHKQTECDVCHMKVQGKWQLRAHKQAMHGSGTHSTQKPFCRECNIHFKNMSGLKTHLKMSANHCDSNGRRYKLTYVEPSTTTGADLKMDSDKNVADVTESNDTLFNVSGSENNSSESENSKLKLGNQRETMDLDSKFAVTQMSEEEMFRDRKRMRECPTYLKSKFKCEMCIRGFKRKFLYDLHITEKHLEKLGEPCLICGARCRSEDMRQHKREHYKSYECKMCQYKNSELSVMEQHYSERHVSMISENKAQYKCKHCPYLPVFKTRSGYKYHMASRHSATRPRCEICGKQYTCRATLSRHTLLHHTGVPLVECDVCHKTMASTSVTNHKRMVHMAINDEGAFCIECNKQFKHMATYHAHLLLHSNHITPNSKKHECNTCGKKFSLPSMLRAHHNKVHLRLGEKDCHLCNKKFITATSLTRHVKVVHEGMKAAKDHKCVVCGRMFSKHLLKQHMNTHTGDRPYHCKLCPDTFAQKSSLYMHNRLVHLKLKKNRKPAKSKEGL